MAEEKQKKDPLQTGGTINRHIDNLAGDTLPFLGKSWVFVSRTRVKTWQGLFMLAFISGAFVSFVWSVSLEIESLSKASGTATLSMTSPDATGDGTTINVAQDDTFSVDLVVDTGGMDVVATRALVTYDPADFQLTGWDTSNSIFGVDNSCVYQGNPCQIVDNDTAGGTISLTLAKPSPGVRNNSGLVATLTFKALRSVSSTTNNIRYTFIGQDNETDSDVIEEGGSANDLLSSVSGIRALVGAPVCTDYNYSAWDTCQSNGTQTRTVVAGIPSDCSGGATPDLTQSCTYTPPICADYNYSPWGACQQDRTQTRTVLSGIPEGCDVNGGAIPVLSQECYNPDNPPECTSHTYGDWGVCQTNGTQTRTVVSSVPDGCSGGVVPETFQLCTNTPLPCTGYEYSEWGECQPDNMESRTVISGIPAGCIGGEMPITIGSCTYSGTGERCTDYEVSAWGACQLDNYQSRTVTGIPARCTQYSNDDPPSFQRCIYTGEGNTCTSFEYSDWTKCRDGKQARSIATSAPSGCTGGNPDIERSCASDASTRKGELSRGSIKVIGEKTKFGKREDFMTDDPSLSFKGSDSDIKNGKVEIYRDGKLKDSTKVDGEGNWSIKVTEKENGTSRYAVRYIDADGNEVDKSASYNIFVDDEDPEITDLPRFLTKARGEKVWWDAKDNEDIDHYRYQFLGYWKETKSKSFNIPANTPTGLHMFQLKVYDDVGNSTSKTILIRVR